MAPSKLNSEQFLDVVQKSGLVDPAQLVRIVSELGSPSESSISVEVIANRLVDSHAVTRWQCDRLLEGRHRGFLLGKYLLLGHLGYGGMSSVYLAEHSLMKRRVAIKVLPKERVEDASYLDRFYLEARAVAHVDHGNIVRVFDVDHDGPHHFIVMEYIDGYDLQCMVRNQGVLDPALAADFIRQAALGLAHAHQAGLIHRDIKPANLMVDRHNVVKVLDLGLARFADDKLASVTITHAETILGTADYLAPEQAVNSHQVDARADIYSLGCSLYYLLTGHPPFHTGSLSQRLMAHQRSQPPSICKEQPAVPQDLVNICQRMMAKKPGDRFQTAAEVARVLEHWLAAHGDLLLAAAVAHKMGESSSVPQSPRRSDSSSRVRELDPQSRISSSETSPIMAEATSKSLGNAQVRRAVNSTTEPEDALAFLESSRFSRSSLSARSERLLERQHGIPAWLWATIGFIALLIALLLVIALL